MQNVTQTSAKPFAALQGAIGRSMADAPEIDGAVYLNGETNVKPGDIVRVKVENADEYDLWGSRV
ncbi:hypothetical protein BEQ22_06135 [Salmonella enterica subsp. enterica serovar Poona]|nr:hypothetical protein [Salmonella enterica subsp. enterica serovar Poona]